jgi:hypothetical protein
MQREREVEEDMEGEGKRRQEVKEGKKWDREERTKSRSLIIGSQHQPGQAHRGQTHYPQCAAWLLPYLPE